MSRALPWLNLKTILPAVCLGLTLALYWRTLSFPFFWDDIANFEFAATRTFTQIWADASGFPYYRPVLFTWWKLHQLAFPFGNTLFLHGVNLLTHALNGALVGWLMYQFGQRHTPFTPLVRQWASVGAAIFFILYPPAVLPIALVASHFHLAVTTASLATAVCAVQYVQTRKRSLGGLALIFAALGPFVHESGVMTGPLAALVVFIYLGLAVKHFKGFGLLLAAASAVFLPIWLVIPKAREPMSWVGWESLGQSLTFFAQVLSWPFQFLARPLFHLTGWSDLAVVWLVTLGVLGGCGVLLFWPPGQNQRPHAWRLGGLAIGWIGLAMLPAVLALPFPYIITSPRLMYYTAPGAALFWGLILAHFVQKVATPRGQHVLAVVLLSLSAMVPTLFIYRLLDLHQLGLQPVWELVTLGKQYPHERHLLVNPVDWVATTEMTYMLGHEGLTVMPLYVSPAQLIAVHTGLHVAVDMAEYPPVQTELPGHYYNIQDGAPLHDWATFAQLAPQYERVWLTTYGPTGIHLSEAGSLALEAAQAPTQYQARFEQTLYLLDLQMTVTPPQMQVVFNWHFAAPAPGATVFVHVYDCAGNVLGQGDGAFLARMVPLDFLTPGMRLRDVRSIVLDHPSPDACYRLETGLFRPDGSRLRAFAPDGSEYPNQLFAWP